MKENLDLIRSNITKSVSSLLDSLDPWMQILILLTVSIITLLFFFSIAKSISKNKQWFYRFTKTQLLADLIAQSISMVIKISAIIIILYIIGAQSIVGFILGTAGVLGLGVSFAFKDIVENYIAGIFLSIRQPFLKGDHILVDSNEGIVLRMTTRMTMIKSFDGNNVSIPNAKIFKSTIINFSVIPERRFHFYIGVDPDTDANFARKVGLKTLKEFREILDNPPPSAQIDSIGDSSIVLSFYGWVDQDKDDFYQLRSLAISTVKEAIEDQGIEIPDPSYTIKIKKIDTEEHRSDANKNLKIETEFDDVEYLMSSKTKQNDVARKQVRSESSSEGLLEGDTTE